MALENALIAKIVGSVTVLGGAGSAGVVYRNEIINKFQDVFGKNESKDYFFVVAGTVAVDTGEQSQKTLYEAKEPKTKNYQCQIGSEKYECDIVKEIKEPTGTSKKWINTKSDFETKEITKNDITKEKFNTADNLFLLKILATKKPTLTWDATQKIDIIENVASADKTFKKFGQLTPIFGKENNQILGKVNLFLGKVSALEGKGSDNKWTVAANETYKCGFDTAAINKDCEIYKFADSQTPKADTDYSQLTFVGNLENDKKIKDKDEVKENEYYLIKFTVDLKEEDISNKTILYTKVDPSTPAKTINFSPLLISFLHTKADKTNNNLLLINN